MPTDAELMRLSETVRGSYILFEQDHKSLVCSTLAWLILGFNDFVTLINFVHNVSHLSAFLWPPYIAGADILFCSCGFYLSSFLVRDWMFTILPHMMGP